MTDNDTPLQDCLTDLKAALRKINLIGVDEVAINKYADRLLLKGWSGVPAVPLGEMPAGKFEPDEWRKEAKHTDAVERLENITRTARALRQALEGAPGNVHHALLHAARQAGQPEDYTSVQHALSDLSALNSIAPEAVLLLNDNAPPSKSGPTPKSFADDLAEYALNAFENVSGRTATRSENAGEFPDFLGEVFSILGVPASAMATTRRVIERRNATGVNSRKKVS